MLISDIVPVISIIVLIIIIYYWSKNRKAVAFNEVEKWAVSNYYTIINSHFTFFNGHFFYGGGLFSINYSLTLKDSDGTLKKCLVSVGDPYMGMLLNKDIAVKWR